MKYALYILIVSCMGFLSCKKTIDLIPESNPNAQTYFNNEDEVRTALNGVYNGLQRPMFYEWQLTELRSDNTKMSDPKSTSSVNRDLSDLDMFMPATTHAAMYSYWLATYNNIRNANIVLQNLGVFYDPSSGNISLSAFKLPITDSVRKQLAGEAMFIRAYHYFNLVRLFGGVFLVHTPISADESKMINRSTVADIYKFIEADLKSASGWLSGLKFSQIATANIGRATKWSAEGLLGKVYLTENKKAEAIVQLQDVISNSGYSLQSSYANVFSITNEMNSEILFSVRYKAGGLGLGSSFGNDFAPLGSGSAVINGSGLGNNYPTTDLNNSYAATDARKAVNIGVYGSGSSAKLYVKKYLNPVVLTNDGEADWPVLRYADILLLLAEAQGYSTSSIGLINQVRARTSLGNLPATVNSVATFEQALANERRWEFAFENQRWFDLVRFNTTLTTITAEQVMKNHFANEYASHYALYLAPTPTLAQLQANVTSDHLILPIPQHEIDTNTQLVIPQNPGY